MRPQDPSCSDTYELTLNSSDTTPQALTVLEAVPRRHPKNGQILKALVFINRDAGRRNDAIRYVEQLVPWHQKSRKPGSDWTSAIIYAAAR